MLRKPPQNHTVSSYKQSHFLPASSIYMLAVVTCDTMQDKWSLMSSGSVQLWGTFTKTAQSHPYSCYKTRSATPLDFHLYDIQQVMGLLPGFRSTKAGSHKTIIPQRCGYTSEYFVTHIITHIRWFYWHSWTECWGYLWTGVAHSHWGYITGGLGTLDTLYGNMDTLW